MLPSFLSFKNYYFPARSDFVFTEYFSLPKKPRMICPDLHRVILNPIMSKQRMGVERRQGPEHPFSAWGQNLCIWWQLPFPGLIYHTAFTSTHPKTQRKIHFKSPRACVFHSRPYSTYLSKLWCLVPCCPEQLRATTANTTVTRRPGPGSMRSPHTLSLGTRTVSPPSGSCSETRSGLEHSRAQPVPEGHLYSLTPSSATGFTVQIQPSLLSLS